MSAGVCSIVKSKPRRVRRSISDTSLDVHGAVTVEKVWMGEGGKIFLFCGPNIKFPRNLLLA